MPSVNASALQLVAGEPWRVVVRVEDITNRLRSFAVEGINPLAGSLFIRGGTEALFAIATRFSLRGNAAPGANRDYLVETVTAATGGVVVTVDNDLLALDIAAVDVSRSALRVSTTGIDQVLRFATGATVVVEGNANDASNAAYRVVSSYVPAAPSASLWVVLTPSLPGATTATGDLIVPTIPPEAGQTATASLQPTEPLDVSGWSFDATVRAGKTLDDDELATVDVDLTAANAGQVVLSLTAEQTAALAGRSLVWLDLLGVADEVLALGSVRSLWWQGDSAPVAVDPARVDNRSLRFQGGGLVVRILDAVTERA